MRPWWERDPAALAAEIEELTKAGFRVHREVAVGERMTLVMSSADETYRVVYFYQLDRSGNRLLAVTPWPNPIFAVRCGGTALEAVTQLKGRQRLSLADLEAGCVFLPDAWRSDIKGAGGLLVLGRSRTNARAYAARSLTGSRQSLAADSGDLARAFPDVVEGLWARAETGNEVTASAEEVVATAEAQLAEAHGLSDREIRDRLSLRGAVGALVRSPSGAPGPAVWLFVRRGLDGEPLVLSERSWFERDYSSRAPFAPALRGKSATIIGCGSVGWTVALELARSGVHRLFLYDDDAVQPHNVARLDTTLGAAGRLKVDALAETLQAIAPDIVVEARPFEVGLHVGAAALVADRPDLIINLTGEEISTDETNVAALLLGRPALIGWVSNRVLAGRIIRVRPDISACYECVRQAEPEPIRSYGAVPTVREIAWEGACFNVDAFACAFARLAVLTLIGEPVSASNPDHVVLEFGDVAPTTRVIHIPRDLSCRVCR